MASLRINQGRINAQRAVSDDASSAQMQFLRRVFEASTGNDSQINPDFAAVRKLWRDSFSHSLDAVSNNFENPAWHLVLSALTKQIEEELKALKLDLRATPLFGTMATGRVNGFAATIPGTSYRAIFVEDGLFGFANLVSKAIAIAFPENRSGNEDEISFSVDWKSVRKQVDANPEITRRFFDALAAYVIRGHPHAAEQYLLEGNVAQLSNALRNSIEQFILSHEYGHIVAGHLDDDVATRKGW